MTRCAEARMRWGLTVLAWGLGACALLLGLDTVLSPRRPLEIQLPALPAAAPAEGRSAHDDALIARLAAARTSRTAVKVEAPRKSMAPSLATLVRVRGIMEYGETKNNEAIIEIVRLNQTRSFRVGETIPEVNAVIVKIGSGVTFEYEGGTIEMNVYTGASADTRPAAGGGIDAVGDAAWNTPRRP